MTDRWVVLLRGINVAPSTRVAMADLRALLVALGHSDVVTLLQSGNVLLSSPARPAADLIEAAIESGTGVRSKVVVLSVREFSAIAGANPLVGVSDDLSKLAITFLGREVDPAAIVRPDEDDLAPEQLVITPRAIYQWFPLGVLRSKLAPSWWRQIDAVATARNVRTVNRILAAIE